MSEILTRIWREHRGANRSGIVHVSGSFTTTTAGAVSTSDTPGFTVTKTNAKTGRYRCQLITPDGSAASPCQKLSDADDTTAVEPWGIQNINVTICSPTADSAFTKDAASTWRVRNFTPKSGYFDIQLLKINESTGTVYADAEAEEGSTLLIGFDVKTSSAEP